MVQGENTTLLRYDVLKASGTFTFELLPLFAVRGYHELMHANEFISRTAIFKEGILAVKAYEGTPTVYLKIPGASFQNLPDWYYHFYYSQEAARGLDCREDLFTYGKFSIALKQGDSLSVLISTADPAAKNARELFQNEITRKKQITGNASPADTLSKLKLAGDQFIVGRGTDLKTIIAGYHWFTDWGRDTMISLPGLCLRTGRWEDAKRILEVFSKYVSMGMLPNRFPDQGSEPEYNNADATLWYFIAIDTFLSTTGQNDFVLEILLPVLTTIIEWHFKGTRYHIHVTGEGLLYAGEQGQQLTWMDARVDGKVITPRMGYPVEIQALWYNALKIYAKLLRLRGEPDKAADAESHAEQTRRTFNNRFWDAENNYLYDTIDENDRPDASLRPNQLFAISLPYALIEGSKAEAVLKIVTEKLVTPAGLRSLSAEDPRYIGVYKGDQAQRDSAYHQGTVWAWLLGPYLEAVRKVTNDTALIRKTLEASSRLLQEACIGSVSEIFDGDPPHLPRGCIAQAWSVAELLRILHDYAV
jgi:predicted glycogen debranching enzyme